MERDVKLSFAEAFRVFTLGLLAGLVTPGQLGELYKIVDIKKLGGSYKDGFMSSLGDRVLDLLIIMVMAAFYFLHILFPSVSLFTNSSFFVFVVFLFSLISTWLWLRLVNKSEKVNIPLLYKTSFLTFAAYTIYVFRLWLLFKALGLSLPLVFFISSMSLMSIITLLPLSVMGLGLREVSLFQLLADTEITENQIISFSLFVVLLYLFNGVIGMLSWVWQYKTTKPQNMRK